MFTVLPVPKTILPKDKHLYAPTNPSSRATFYKNILQHIDKNNNQNLILTGDFNIVEDLFLDRQGGTPSNSHLLGLIVTKIKQKYDPKDTWCKNIYTKRSFTCHNYNYSIHSRIDRIYITEHQKILETNIIPNYLYDQEILALTLLIKKQKSKGNGYRKLNALILQQKSFEDIFKNFWKN